jgi:hypothetical protein
MLYFLCLAAEDGVGRPVRWVSHAMPCLAYTLEHNRHNFLCANFYVNTRRANMVHLGSERCT